MSKPKFPRILFHDDPEKAHKTVYSAEHEAEFLKANPGYHEPAEYPKAIKHPDDPAQEIVVASEDEEIALLDKWAAEATKAKGE